MEKAAILAAAIVVAGGAGFADRQDFDLGGFSQISVGDGVELSLDIGSDYSVEADGTRAGLRQLRVRQRGDTLVIGRDRPWSLFGQRADVHVYVAMPSVHAIDASSGSAVEGEGDISGLAEVDASSGAHVVLRGVESDELFVDAHAGAIVALIGRCGDITLDVTSGAAVDASRLTCASGAAEAIAGGAAVLHVTDAIEAHAVAGGSVDVAGNPMVQDVSRAAGGSVVLH